MRVDVLIKRLNDEQTSLAREALTRPQGKDGYDYGRVVGMYAGLEQAKNLINAILEEQETRNSNI